MSDLIEFRHLKYIVALAETGNFTRAAERLFVAQPSLSRQIKDIEEEIGTPIFERTRDGVLPTPIGQMLIDYAVATLYGRTQIVKIAREIYLGNIPPLRMGFSSFVNSRYLQSFRTGYSKLFPKCGLQLSGGDTVHVLQRIERGDLDCGMLTLPITGPNWTVQHFASSPLVACMKVDDPLVKTSEVTIRDLEERLTIFRDPDGHPSAHTRLMQMFSDAGISLHISSSAATPHDIQLLVRDGYGIALVREDLLLESDITTRRISGVEWRTDTAFVHSINAKHPALPLVGRSLLNKPTIPKRKEVKNDRPQLPLWFDFSA